MKCYYYLLLDYVVLFVCVFVFVLAGTEPNRDQQTKPREEVNGSGAYRLQVLCRD